MADTQSILQLGIEAARSNDKAEARELFRLVTREDPNNVQGWLWLAGVAEDREERRAALERVVQIDPNNDLARKGLAALGGASAATAAMLTTPAAPPEPAPASAAASSDQDLADSFDSIESYAAAPEARRARTYDQPEQVGAYVPPDFGDEYDLSDYQDRPRVAAADIDDRPTTVYVEDEEPRRRGFGWFWPLLLIGALAAALLLFFIFNDRDPEPVADNPGSSPAASVAAGDPNASADVGASVAPDASTDAAGLIEGSPAPSDGAAVPLPADGTGASPDAVASDPAASVAPSDGVAAPPADGASPSPDAAAPDAGAASPAPVESAAPAESAPPAEPQPAPSEAPAAPADVASANPAVVDNGQVLQGGDFQYGYSGLSNVATGSYGGSPPARGRYLIVLATVGNTGSAPAQIPDGFFVIKDAQGRVYDFNRAASVDYINRFGGTGPRGAGDYAADTTLQPGAPLGSVPLLFDVAPDATNLVFFSRANVNQGFLIDQNLQ
jgi:hypothetical protein